MIFSVSIRALTGRRAGLLLSCSVLALMASPAFAEPATQLVTTSYTYNFGSNPGTAVSNSISSPSSVDLLPIANNGSNSIFGHDYGTFGGTFGSRSSGAGVYSISGRTEYQQTITNTNAAATDYTVTYTLANGGLNVQAAPTASGAQTAAVTAILTATGGMASQTLVNYAASLNFNSTSQVIPSFSETGLVLNAAGPTLAPDSGDYSWNPYTATVDLGILAPGASVDLDYVITSAATGSTPFQTRLTLLAYGGNGGYGGLTNGGSALGRFGDPFTGTGTAFVVKANALAVPEPASLAVLGAGFAALASFRRRRA